MRALLEAGIALTSELSLDAVLERLIETAARLTSARYAALGVIDPAGTGLERFVTYGSGIGHLRSNRGARRVGVELDQVVVRMPIQGVRRRRTSAVCSGFARTKRPVIPLHCQPSNQQ